jgi:signal peptide peptidase SppA
MPKTEKTMPQPTLNLHAVQQFARKPALVCPTYADEIASLASAPAIGQVSSEDAAKQCAATYGADLNANKPFIFSQGIAVVPMWGALLHRGPWMSSYATGYEYIGSRFAQAMADPDVKGIIFDVNSYGGHVAGNFELSDEIYAARGKKPMLSIIDAHALSGGYSLGSAADRMIATPSSSVGSIGVVMMHMSIEKALKDYGVKVTYIYAGKHKVDGNPFEDLSDDVKAALQASVKRSYDSFVTLVSRNRGMDEDAVRKTEAAVFDSDEALSLGLIDAVMPARAALAEFAAELSSSSTPTNRKEGKKMSNEKKKGGDEEEVSQADVTAAAENARKAERARIKGITSSEAAAKRPKLAAHLANETDISAEAATKLLEASAEEQPEKSAEAEAGKGKLSEAMKKDANKTAGTDGDDDDDDGGKKEMSRAEQISRDYQAATGVNMTAKK